MSMNKSFRTEWQNEDELKDSEETKSLLVLFFRMIASVFIVVSLDLQLLFKEQSSSTQGILVTLAAFQDFLLSSSIHHAIHSKSKGISSSLLFFTSLLSHITLLSASFQNFSLMSNWDIFFANESTLEKAMQFLFFFLIKFPSEMCCRQPSYWKVAGNLRITSSRGRSFCWETSASNRRTAVDQIEEPLETWTIVWKVDTWEELSMRIHLN